MNAETRTALEAAQHQLTRRIKAEADVRVRAAAALLDAQACAGKVIAIGEARTAAVVAARPADVLRLTDEKRVAEIDSEISTTKATALAAKHAAAVVAVRDARGAVAIAAQRVLDCETIELAAEFSQALDHALSLGARLQSLCVVDRLNTPVNVPLPVLPPEVVKALERLPRANPFDAPIQFLKNGGAGTDARAARLRELMSA